MKRLLVGLVLVVASVAAAAPAAQIKITAAECKRAKLPERAISIDTTDTGMIGATFPDTGVYLRLSGPPGGPLGMAILAHGMVHADDAGFRAWVIANYIPDKTTDVGKVELAGRTWRAVAFVKGAQPARSINWFLIDDKGLAIHLQHSYGARPLDPAELGALRTYKPFDRMLPTLAISP